MEYRSKTSFCRGQIDWHATWTKSQAKDRYFQCYQPGNVFLQYFVHAPWSLYSYRLRVFRLYIDTNSAKNVGWIIMCGTSHRSEYYPIRNLNMATSFNHSWQLSALSVPIKSVPRTGIARTRVVTRLRSKRRVLISKNNWTILLLKRISKVSFRDKSFMIKRLFLIVDFFIWFHSRKVLPNAFYSNFINLLTMEIKGYR